jgi:hypothetical protein
MRWWTITVTQIGVVFFGIVFRIWRNNLLLVRQLRCVHFRRLRRMGVALDRGGSEGGLICICISSVAEILPHASHEPTIPEAMLKMLRASHQVRAEDYNKHKIYGGVDAYKV